METLISYECNLNFRKCNQLSVKKFNDFPLLKILALFYFKRSGKF